MQAMLGIEYDIKHILFECTALTRVRRHVQGWLSTFNIYNFNRETIIEMKNIKDLPNYITSLYKATVWENRSLAQLRDINEQAVINSLDSSTNDPLSQVPSRRYCIEWDTE